MFTGIVKDRGSIVGLHRQGSGLRLAVRYTNEEVFADLAIDESVAINGACQTVVALGEHSFEVDTIAETLKKTTLGSFRAGDSLNLERALRPVDRLGGHFVQGHVDCVGEVTRLVARGESQEIWIGYPAEFEPFVVPVGSIAIDGVSLTVADVKEQVFCVAIIPYTFAHTTISMLRPGVRVNLEFDILGKYIVRQRQLEQKNERPVSSINENWLKQNGF
ncbi:MAG: riboflavin synthase [Prosthecochloris sp.]|uniref:riboflavin synthase n=1 Tax=Prosthecochloris sp. TaxID=290513 RepID=UPI0013C9ED17|nr:riboflavin synthase [Prosthecochloris sp.]NEX11402.1 riboflavin synthase [Prosthecochloris sp.]